MRSMIGAAALTAAHCFLAPTAGLAEDVTLRARNGGLAVTGSLIGHDGETYRVKTQWGVMTVEADAVDCSGPGCPDLARLAAELRLGVEPWLADFVLFPRIKAYAEAEGLDFLHLPAENLIELSRAGRPELRLHLVRPSGAPESLLLDGEADAVLAIPATPEAGRLIARLPMVVVTGSAAPEGRLPLSALHRMRQEGASWEALGATERPLVWHGLGRGGALDRGAELAMGPGAGETQKSPDLQELRAALARDPWGIALLPRGLTGELPERRLAGDCGFELDGSPLAVASGDDGLALPLHWIEAGPRLPAPARRLAAHLRSTAGQTASGAAPYALAPVALSQMPLRLLNAALDPNPELSADDRRAAVSALANARRLPHTFRPGEGEDALSDLIERLMTGLAEGSEVLVVGFADGAGPAEAARDRSLKRAEALTEMLRKAAPELTEIPLIAMGLGEALPLRCVSSPDARRANERVEVWLRPLTQEPAPR